MASVTAKFFNELGEEILEFKKTLYLKESGTTKAESVISTEGIASANSQGIDVSFPHIRSIISGGHEVGLPYWPTSQVASNGTCYKIETDYGVVMPVLNMDPTDTVFYQINSVGLHSHVEHIADFPGIPTGGFAVANTEGNASIPYKIISTDIPGYTPAESAGLILRKSDGTKVFDSRYPLFSVFQVEIVSKATVNSVLLNGSTHDITLRKSAPGCYVACPFLTALHSWEDEGLKMLMLKQINNTTIRISRETLLSGSLGTERTFTQDLIIFIGR